MVAKDGCTCEVCMLAHSNERRAHELEVHAFQLRKAAWEKIKIAHPELVPVAASPDPKEPQ